MHAGAAEADVVVVRLIPATASMAAADSVPNLPLHVRMFIRFSFSTASSMQWPYSRIVWFRAERNPT